MLANWKSAPGDAAVPISKYRLSIIYTLEQALSGEVAIQLVRVPSVVYTTGRPEHAVAVTDSCQFCHHHTCMLASADLHEESSQ